MSIDVNTAFAAERADQMQAARDAQADIDRRIAEGTLRHLGGNRYEITDPTSWDNGEVLYLSGGRLMPQHGLDVTETGDVALYTAVPAWHGLGNVIPGGTSDIDEVLRLGGIDFTVSKRAVRYGFDGDVLTMPDQFVTVREDTGAGLGVVGAKYTEIQNRRMFEFLEDLVGQHGVIWQSAGPLRGGRKVFISMRVPDDVVVDPGGLDDTIQLFIVAINSHDGTSTAQVVVTPWRPVCQNTERFAVRDAV
jgi:hypothetical protein